MTKFWRVAFITSNFMMIDLHLLRQFFPFHPPDRSFVKERMSSPILKAATGGGVRSSLPPIQLFVKHHAVVLQKILTVALFYLVGVLYYKSVEDGWTTADCLYFITVSITTVGYGVSKWHVCTLYYI